MGIISKTAQVKVAPKTLQHYKKLGYEFCHFGDEIEVKVEDLTRSTHVKVWVACDKCDKKSRIIYRDYLKSLDNNGQYLCKSCAKIGKTTNKRINRKGAGRKRGYKRSEKTKAKFVATMQSKYGVDNPAQSLEILAKSARTYYKNSSKQCSKQQYYIYNLYNQDNIVELNYPISHYNVDMCLVAEKLICEYDGGGHLLSVITGKVSAKEYQRKEITRFTILKRANYKQMRIISSKDLIPSDVTLLQMLDDARNYFSPLSSTFVDRI